MAFRHLRPILFLTLLLFLLCCGSILLLHSLIYRPGVQNYLLKRLSERTGIDVHAEQIQFLFWKGIGIRACNLELRTSDGGPGLTGSKIRITLSLPQLLRGEVVPTLLALEDPRIRIDGRGSSCSASGWDPLLEEIPLKILAGFPRVLVERGRVSVAGVPLGLSSLSLTLSRMAGDPVAFHAAVSGNIEWQGDAFPFSITGHIAADPASGPSGHMKASAFGIPLSNIRLPDVPVRKGTADMQLTVEGALRAGIAATGEIAMKGVDFAISDEGDAKSFSFDRLDVPFKASFSESALDVPSFQVKGPGFALNVRSRLDFKNRSDPHLDLNVTADAMTVETFRRIFPSSLVSSWVDTSLFPIFSGGRVRVDRFSLNGTLHEIGDLDMSENAGALLLQLTCTDLTAFGNYDIIPVERVCGKVSIENGSLCVSCVTGHFRDSAIQEGTLLVKSLYDGIPDLRVTATASLRIQDLMQQKDIPLVPDNMRTQIERFSSATGWVEGTVEIGYEKGWPSPRLLKAGLIFKDCAVGSSAGLIFPVFLKEARLIVDGPKRDFAAKGWWGRSEVEAVGEIGQSWETGAVRMVGQADMMELINRFYPDLGSRLFFRGPVPCRLTLAKEINDWRFQGNLDPRGASFETPSMTVAPFVKGADLAFSGRIEPGKRLILSRVTCSSGESGLELAGIYDLTKEGWFHLNTTSRNLRLQDLGIRFKKGSLTAKGALGFEAAIEGFRSRPETIVANGEANGTDLFFSAGEFPLAVEDGSLAVAFKGKDLFINSLDLKLGKTPLHVEANLKGWDGIRGEATIHSDFLHFSDLVSSEIINYFKKGPGKAGDSLPSAGLSASGGWQEAVTGFMKKSDLHLELTAPKSQWEGFPCGPIHMAWALRSGDLYISRSSLAWDHGYLLLSGHVKRGEAPEKLFSWYIDMIQQPLQELPPAFDFITSRGEGLVTLEAFLFARGTRREELISSLTGSVNILLEQGIVKKSNILITVLDSLSLQRIVEKRPAHLSKKGIYFQKIGAHVDLEKGVARSKDVVMRSPVFNAAATGEMDLRTKIIKAEIGVQPLGTLDFLISNLPVAGYLLTGDQEALFVEYFKVNGPVSDPKVEHMSLKSLGNGTVGFLSRLFLAPKRIYDRMVEAARDFDGNGYPAPDEHLDPRNDVGR